LPASPETPTSPFAILARLERGGRTESWHLGAAAVARPGGELVARVADPALPIYLRSSAKPFQALPLVLAGGIERFALTADDLGLICASHSGGDAHAARALSLLARGGFSPADLLCGAHRPLGPESAAELDRRGEEPTALHNNCSGKHAGMLLACRLLDLPVRDYIAFDHPLQLRIRDEIAALAGVAADAIPRAIDGCSAPTYLLPLGAGARCYAALADPGAAGLPAATAEALARIARAMGEAPEMVAGPGRFTTALIRETGGRIVAKEGAEGVYGMAIRGPVAMGVLLKIADGSERGRDTVALDLLRQLGSISADELSRLAAFYRPPQRNHRGIVIGEIVSDFELEEA